MLSKARGHNRIIPGRSKPRVLLKPVPSLKEGRRHEASDKPEEPQQVCGPTTFQDGRDPCPELPLDGKNRCEEHLLHDADPTKNSQLHGTTILKRGRLLTLPVLPPAIQPVVLSLGLYQDPEAGTNPTLRVSDKASGIHR